MVIAKIVAGANKDKAHCRSTDARASRCLAFCRGFRRRGFTRRVAAASPGIQWVDADYLGLHPEVLRTFAITMFANIRSVDRFGRYGGEEFLLVLPDMPVDGATRAIDRLRAIVADLDWSAFSPGMKVTLSAGVATLKPEETADSLLARADRALYAAKAQGRNRIAQA